MASSPFDELVHRVNNLLGTIQVQADVARLSGSLEAHMNALRLIEESALRTQQDLQRLRNAARAPGSESRSDG